MQNFQRQRPSQVGGTPTTIPFLVTHRQVDKFNERFGPGWSWSTIEKAIAYKTSDVTLARMDSKDPTEWLWEALVPIPREGEELRILFKLDRDKACFFVIDLTLQRSRPRDPRETLEQSLTLEFVGQPSSYATEEFIALRESLSALKVQKSRRRPEVQDEIKTWAKYLQAMEKITQEKAILFKVRETQRYPQRKRGIMANYELDIEPFAQQLKEELLDILVEQPIARMQVTQEEAYIELSGFSDAGKEWGEALEAAVMENPFFQWSVPPKQALQVLPLQVVPRYQTQEARDKSLAELDGKLRAAGSAFQRHQQHYQWKTWADWDLWQNQVRQASAIWSEPAAPTVQLQVTFWLDDAAQREQVLQAWARTLQAEGAQAVEVLGHDQLRFALPADQKPNLQTKSVQFELTKVELTATATPRNTDAEVPPQLTAKAGAIVKGNSIQLIADNRKGLQERYTQLKNGNPDFSFPDFGTLTVQYEAGFEYLLQQGAWKTKHKQRLGKIQGAKWAGADVQIQALSGAEVSAICAQVMAWEEGLTCTVKSVEAKLAFKQEDAQYCKQLLDDCAQRLQQAYAAKLALARGKGKSANLEGTLTLANVMDWQPVKEAIMKTCGQEVALHFPQPEGCTRMEMVFVPQGLEDFLSERWKSLRGCTLKFLTEDEAGEYKKEISGKGGRYNGGMELGKLIGLRNQEARVLLREEANEIRIPKTGFLLPTFIGDLAQLQRLREAISLVQMRKNGLPINPNLCNFIFDAKAAKEIVLGHDVRSDRDWQLKYKLNEAALNPRQREAVWKVLQAQDLVLVQGPPGTGKTTVIAEIVWQMLQENADQKILISSQSHLAVDNALERLYKKNLIRPLRIAARAGNSIEPEGRQYFQEVIEGWAKASPGSKEEKENQKNAVSAWLERMGNAVQPTEEFRALQEKWCKQILQPTPDIKQLMKDIYLQNVNVVAATCLECGQRDFKALYAEEGFDCVIVDEASKATPPEMLVPLVLAKKVVIIGDHKQLPPMIEEKKIEEVLRDLGENQLADDMEAFKTSQFEKLFLDAHDSVKVTLNTQYRMHNHIMQVINAFYEEEGGLTCGIEEDMDKPDFALRGSRWHGLDAHPLLSPDDHVIWVEVNSPEISHNPSYSNDGEVDAVDRVLEYLMQAQGFQAYQEACTKEEDKEVGLISFYGKQVEKLHDVVEKFKGKGLPIRLRTVDKFQGMERNMMIVSTVRSDMQIAAGGKEDDPLSPTKQPKSKKNTDIGFAKDFRRVNVAFSRARRILIIVGNESHFANNHPMYKNIKSTIGRFGNRINISQL